MQQMIARYKPTQAPALADAIHRQTSTSTIVRYKSITSAQLLDAAAAAVKATVDRAC